MNRALFPSGRTLLCMAGGALALAGTGLRTLSLSQGSAGARLLVLLLLLLLAFLALLLLRLEGYGWSRLPVALVPIGLALFLRALLLDHTTYDYYDFLAQWAAFFRDNGGFAAVKLPIGNYNAPYLYFLAAISYLPVPDLYLIKLFSILFDVLLAWGGLRLVRVFLPNDPSRPLLAFCLLLLLPTVVLNGSCWAQCDALYGALCLHALASALDRRPGRSVVLLAIAFSFKLQTVFLLPLWCALWFTGRVRLRHFFLFPLTYFFTILPALLLGKPLADILGVYIGQTGEYAAYLTLNAPSVYAFIPYGVAVDSAPAARLGILAAFAMTAALLAVLLVFRKRVDRLVLLVSATVLTVGIPFLLPNMHDRYFYLADLLTLVLLCVLPRCAWGSAVLVEGSSLSCYSTYLRLEYTLPLRLGRWYVVMGLEALMMAAAAVWLWLLLLQLLRRPPAALHPSKC